MLGSVAARHRLPTSRAPPPPDLPTVSMKHSLTRCNPRSPNCHAYDIPSNSPQPASTCCTRSASRSRWWVWEERRAPPNVPCLPGLRSGAERAKRVEAERRPWLLGNPEQKGHIHARITARTFPAGLRSPHRLVAPGPRSRAHLASSPGSHGRSAAHRLHNAGGARTRERSVGVDTRSRHEGVELTRRSAGPRAV
jgi:hypothetical protein